MHAERLHVIDEHIVEALEARRPELEDLRDVIGGVEYVLVGAHKQGARGRAVDEADGGLEDRRERPLAPDQHPRDVEAVLR